MVIRPSSSQSVGKYIGLTYTGSSNIFCGIPSSYNVFDMLPITLQIGVDLSFGDYMFTWGDPLNTTLTITTSDLQANLKNSIWIINPYTAPSTPTVIAMGQSLTQPPEPYIVNMSYSATIGVLSDFTEVSIAILELDSPNAPGRLDPRTVGAIGTSKINYAYTVNIGTNEYSLDTFTITGYDQNSFTIDSVTDTPGKTNLYTQANNAAGNNSMPQSSPFFKNFKVSPEVVFDGKTFVDFIHYTWQGSTHYPPSVQIGVTNNLVGAVWAIWGSITNVGSTLPPSYTVFPNANDINIPVGLMIAGVFDSGVFRGFRYDMSSTMCSFNYRLSGNRDTPQYGYHILRWWCRGGTYQGLEQAEVDLLPSMTFYRGKGSFGASTMGTNGQGSEGYETNSFEANVSYAETPVYQRGATSKNCTATSTSGLITLTVDPAIITDTSSCVLFIGTFSSGSSGYSPNPGKAGQGAIDIIDATTLTVSLISDISTPRDKNSETSILMQQVDANGNPLPE